MCSKPRRRRRQVRASQTRTTTPMMRMTAHSRQLLPTSVTTPVQHRLCHCQPTQLTPARCVSWHRVTLDSRWCRAVISVSVSRVPKQCTTKAVAVRFAARPSQWCCVFTNWTYLQLNTAFLLQYSGFPIVDVCSMYFVIK